LKKFDSAIHDVHAAEGGTVGGRGHEPSA
jgi:hypothetical protein